MMFCIGWTVVLRTCRSTGVVLHCRTWAKGTECCHSDRDSWGTSCIPWRPPSKACCWCHPRSRTARSGSDWESDPCVLSTPWKSCHSNLGVQINMYQHYVTVFWIKIEQIGNINIWEEIDILFYFDFTFKFVIHFLLIVSNNRCQHLHELTFLDDAHSFGREDISSGARYRHQTVVEPRQDSGDAPELRVTSDVWGDQELDEGTAREQQLFERRNSSVGTEIRYFLSNAFLWCFLTL